MDWVGIEDSGFIDAAIADERRDSQHSQHQSQQQQSHDQQSKSYQQSQSYHQSHHQKPNSHRFAASASAHHPSCPDFSFITSHPSSASACDAHSEKWTSDSKDEIKSAGDNRKSWHGPDVVLPGSDQSCNQVPNNCTLF